jgi:predicted lipoprotein with Yx(FWY)xxD motif
MRHSVTIALVVLAIIPASASAVSVDARDGSLGTYLTNGSGMTLYVFDKDVGKASHCRAACASAWRPLTARKAPKAGAGVRKSLLSRHKRGDGRRQVLYAGHPLYTYIGDSAPGQTTGQGAFAYGDYWWLMAPSGAKITG